MRLRVRSPPEKCQRFKPFAFFLSPSRNRNRDEDGASDQAAAPGGICAIAKGSPICSGVLNAAGRPAAGPADTAALPCLLAPKDPTIPGSWKASSPQIGSALGA